MCDTGTLQIVEVLHKTVKLTLLIDEDYLAQCYLCHGEMVLRNDEFRFQQNVYYFHVLQQKVVGNWSPANECQWYKIEKMVNSLGSF